MLFSTGFNFDFTKTSAGNSIFDMTNLVLSGSLNLNKSINKQCA